MEEKLATEATTLQVEAAGGGRQTMGMSDYLQQGDGRPNK